MAYHIPVMLEECINGLNIQPEGIYVDITFGGGGHSQAILNALGNQGRLIAFDQDIRAQENIPNDTRLTFIHSNYRYIQKYLRLHDVIPVDGILGDFGVSSYQIDTPERGFSIRYEGKLDMRMNTESVLTAWDVVNTYPVEKLKHVFYQYGELKNAGRIAQIIKKHIESDGSINSTQDLVQLLEPIVAKNKSNKFLAQVFQALRIEVNDELKSIEEFLKQTPFVLKPKGRLVIMSYHSLEDRLVKNFMKYGILKGEPEKDIYGRFECPWKLITRKPIEATEKETFDNPRARSAKLRIAEKI